MDATLTEALKVVTPIIAPTIKVITEKVLTPLVSGAVKRLKPKPDISPVFIEARFEEYLLRYYAKLYYVNTLAFGGRRVRLGDIYQPLTVESSSPNSSEFHTVDRWQDGFLPSHKRVLIVDTAGMGKSTVVKWLFLSAIDKAQTIPLYVELRTVGKFPSILEYILQDVGSYENPIPKDLMVSLLGVGGFCVFFDGFDEIDRERKPSVTEDMQDFIGRYPNNLYLIASRREPELTCFGSFSEFRLRGLTRDEAYSLIRRYDIEQTCAEKLIEELDKGAYQQLGELMAVPMLVSLIFRAYSYKPKIPIRKSIFYRQVFDALYETHDLTKGGCFSRKKFSGLDIDDFHRALRYFGYEGMKSGKIEYTKDELLNTFDVIAKKLPGVGIRPNDLHRDLLETVPLLKADGLLYVWSHKSVQDYFAAQYICYDLHERRTKTIVAICDSKEVARYENVLDMISDTDPQAFRRAACHHVLQGAINFMRPLQECDGFTGDIDYRCAAMFFTQPVALITLISTEKTKARRAANEFDRMAALAKEQLGLTEDCWSSGSLHGNRGSTRVGWWGLPLRNYFIFSIMERRGYDITLERRPHEQVKVAVKAIADALKPNGAYLVDLDPRNPINAKEVVEHVSTLLGGPMGDKDQFLLSYNKCKAVLEEIEEEKRSIESSIEVF